MKNWKGTFTVPSVRPMRSATCALLSPSATKRSTSSSRGVSPIRGVWLPGVSVSQREVADVAGDDKEDGESAETVETGQVRRTALHSGRHRARRGVPNEHNRLGHYRKT